MPPPGSDAKLDLDIERAAFWPALDRVAAAADLRLSLYRDDGKIALAPGPHRPQPVSYHGPFRVALMEVRVGRRLDTGAKTCMARLEVAWPPPLQAFLVEPRPDTFVVQDDKGQPRPMPAGGRGWDFVKNRVAWEIDLALPAMPRAVPRLNLFKGQLAAVSCARMLEFTFDPIEKGKSASGEGVAARLKDFVARKGPEPYWTIAVGLTYPPGGPKLESFQNDWWLRRNEIFLVGKKNGQRFPNNGRFEIDDQVPDRPVIAYRFLDEPEKKLRLGQPAEWKLIYRTPSPLVETAIPFEFRDVPLP